MTDSSLLLTVAILGGTGKEGKGLAYRWAKSGYRIIIGSRILEKAVKAASEINQILDMESSVSGMGNLEAANQADIVVLSVPYAAHRETLETIKPAVSGKILIDVTVPLAPPKVSVVHIPPAGSAAQEAREILGKNTEIAIAFQNISYEHLMSDEYVDCDVLVCGTSAETRSEVLRLVEAAGLTGWDAGPLENAVVIEGLTPVLIGINKKYGSTHAGIRITGVSRL